MSHSCTKGEQESYRFYMYNLFHSPSQMITVGDYGSDDDVHQGDAGKAAICYAERQRR